jgi:DNA gyrase/topoisomerase IV subunit B
MHLSEWLWVEVKRDGKVYKQDYKIGITQNKLKEIGTTKKAEQRFLLRLTALFLLQLFLSMIL